MNPPETASRSGEHAPISMILSAFVDFIELIIFQTERRGLKRIVSAPNSNRCLALYRALHNSIRKVGKEMTVTR